MPALGIRRYVLFSGGAEWDGTGSAFQIGGAENSPRENCTVRKGGVGVDAEGYYVHVERRSSVKMREVDGVD